MVLVGCSETLTVQSVETPTPSVALATPTPTATPSTPTPTPAPTPTREEQLLAACRHAKPVSWAAPYGGKVHPLVVVEDWRGDTWYSDYPANIDVVDSSYAINLKWRNDTWTTPIQLVVCNPDPNKTSVRVASCGGNWKRESDGVVGELLKYQYRSKIRVVVAKTGKTLQTKTLYGTVPPCGGGGASSLDLDVKPPWKKYGYEVTAAQVSKYATTVSKQAVK